jgi:hypothetical protein
MVFALLGFGGLFIAFVNPAMLLGVFMLAAFVIYFVSTFRFLHRGILAQQMLKAKLRDWIKVNAYVTLPFAVLNFMQSLTVIRKPSLLDESIKQMVEMQQQIGLPVQEPGSYHDLMLKVIYIMAFLSVILLLHIMLTFSNLRKYEGLFETRE